MAQSLSTDKLNILKQIAEMYKDNKNLAEIKKLKLEWKEVGGETICPFVEIEFK